MPQFTLTENTADILAQAICRNMRKELMKMAKEIALQQSEQFLSIEETAAFLGCSVSNIYKNKDTLLMGTYVKFGKQLRFPKSQLIKMMNAGQFKSANI